MSDNFRYDVFLCHSNQDKPTVRELAERLKYDGLRVWFDEWLVKTEDETMAKIEKGLKQSRVLLYCMSRSASKAHWMNVEADRFRSFRDPMNLKRKLIPLRLDEISIEDSEWQELHIDWRPRYREREYPTLLEVCQPQGQLDVVIPVGPMAVDRANMPRVEGYKLRAKLKGRPIFTHILENLSFVRERIRFIRLLLTNTLNNSEVKKFKKWINRDCNKYGFKIRMEIGSGKPKATPFETLCSLSPRLTTQFIVHYSDVWACSKTFYPNLLKLLEVPPPRVGRHEYGGILACCRRVPTNFQINPPEIQGPHFVSAKVLQKPFHIIDVHAITDPSSRSYRFANMGIMVGTANLLRILKERKRYQRTELFEFVSQTTSEGRLIFRAHAYDGEWIHCHSNLDVDDLSIGA